MTGKQAATCALRHQLRMNVPVDIQRCVTDGRLTCYPTGRDYKT